MKIQQKYNENMRNILYVGKRSVKLTIKGQL